MLADSHAASRLSGRRESSSRTATQPFGKRLRQGFQDLADAKPLREQPANSVHRAVTATIHADLRSRKGAPHRLGLIDMNVAIGLDAVRQTIDLGGETEKVDAEFSQFAGSLTSNRLVLTVGKFSVVDILDTNKYVRGRAVDVLLAPLICAPMSMPSVPQYQDFGFESRP
jgi:hypothetical protein